MLAIRGALLYIGLQLSGRRPPAGSGQLLRVLSRRAVRIGRLNRVFVTIQNQANFQGPALNSPEQ